MFASSAPAVGGGDRRRRAERHVETCQAVHKAHELTGAAYLHELLVFLGKRRCSAGLHRLQPLLSLRCSS